MKRREGMSSVLDGVRVIDCGQYTAGPLTAMLLTDQGADVIRWAGAQAVEDPN